MGKTFNPYWPVYKNLEEETILLTKYIQFDDTQLDVYSTYIADLLMRCAVEIEAISKELYKGNDGPIQLDNEGKERKLYFDTDCIRYLNDLWGICEKKIVISSSKFYFQDEKNRILTPLQNAHKRGGAEWNKAYQAVKHDRRNSLSCGTVRKLIEALGALYILNIYYLNSDIKLGTTYTPQNDFDSRLGSDMFSVCVVDATINVQMGGSGTDDAMDDEIKRNLQQAIYVLKYTAQSWKDINFAIIKDNERLVNKLTESEEFKRYVVENSELVKGEHLLTVVSKCLGADYISKYHALDSVGMAFASAQKEAILYKNSKIYG